MPISLRALLETDQAERAATELRQDFDQLGRSTENLARDFNRVDREAREAGRGIAQANGGVRTLVTSLGSLALGFVTFEKIAQAAREGAAEVRALGREASGSIEALDRLSLSARAFRVELFEELGPAISSVSEELATFFDKAPTTFKVLGNAPSLFRGFLQDIQLGNDAVEGLRGRMIALRREAEQNVAQTKSELLALDARGARTSPEDAKAEADRKARLTALNNQLQGLATKTLGEETRARLELAGATAEQIAAQQRLNEAYALENEAVALGRDERLQQIIREIESYNVLRARVDATTAAHEREKQAIDAARQAAEARARQDSSAVGRAGGSVFESVAFGEQIDVQGITRQLFRDIVTSRVEDSISEALFGALTDKQQIDVSGQVVNVYAPGGIGRNPGGSILVGGGSGGAVNFPLGTESDASSGSGFSFGLGGNGLGGGLDLINLGSKGFNYIKSLFGTSDPGLIPAESFDIPSYASPYANGASSGVTAGGNVLSSASSISALEGAGGYAGDAALGFLSSYASKTVGPAVSAGFENAGYSGAGYGTAAIAQAGVKYAPNILGSFYSPAAGLAGIQGVAGDLSLFGQGATSTFFDFGFLTSALGFSRGGVVNRGIVEPYAAGGIVDRPFRFPLSGGRSGIAAEAGSPEGILPLGRDSQGRLGVRSVSGGGGVRGARTTYNFNSYYPADGFELSDHHRRIEQEQFARKLDRSRRYGRGRFRSGGA